LIPSGGLVIKAARKARGFTQQEIAEQYGVSKNTISSWESQVTEPTFRAVFEILEMMNYSIEEIYDYANGRG
jgi:transcriptional regulator with XRE-family HTH domain